MGLFSKPDLLCSSDILTPGFDLPVRPRWLLLGKNGRHIDAGDCFLSANLYRGRLVYSFGFVAREELFEDDSVRVEFPEFGCARIFSLEASIAAGAYHVVSGSLDLKPALPKLAEGKVERLS